MPLHLKIHIDDGGVLGIWNTVEDDQYFFDHIELFPDEENEILNLKNRKKTEWLSSRYLLHLLSERQFRGACLKDKFGKPYLKDSPFHISMSHSGTFTAVLASPKLVGIDIQVIVDKIERIAPKFVSDVESVYLDKTKYIESLHCIWGAKESMYKAYGRKQLDFKKHIFVDKFIFEPLGFVFNGQVKKDDFNENYTLFCQQIDQLILVYAIQQ